ncbi:hypothetical protein [Winogradskyella sp. PC D3.3]
MAPIKFEENIKDKLEKRTLSPSSEAWSKLSERLEADEKKSKAPIFWWLSIAAGLLIMVAISVQFFNSNESENVRPQIVEEESVDNQLNNEMLKSSPKASIEIANEDNSVERSESKKAELPINKTSKIIDYKTVVSKKSEPKTQLADQTNSTDEGGRVNQDRSLNNEAQDLLEEAKLKLAVSDAIASLKTEEVAVTDQEIDSLLKVVSKELFKETLRSETTKTVDANALLMSVEDEMGQSFRSRVFEALKESYETVKTAVADRNN